MKNLLLLPLATILMTFSTAYAQDELESSKREKLDALKVAYLTNQLNLTPTEAQAFWPLYNELEGKMHDLRKQKRENRITTKQKHAEMTDAQLSAAVDRELTLEQQELDLKKVYNERFKKILPMKKVAQLYAAEHGFRKELLHRAKDQPRHGGKPTH